jgi:serine/threonine-protein kinase
MLRATDRMSNADETLVGAVLGGKYRLDRVLGKGGMGAVYAAENTLLIAPVALKVLRPDLASVEGLRNRFVQEAQAIAQVRHPNIVTLLDFGYDEALALLYLVQEFLAGTDLKQQLRQSGPMHPRVAIELLLPVMRALTYAHSRGVVHRDLKPDNIFLCETPEGIVPKLIDFGTARVVDAAGRSAQQTRVATLMGTAHYMSPEQVRHAGSVDPRTDVWSLGVVLYHMLTGRFPFEGETPTVVIAGILTREPTRIETYAPQIPADVAALVHGSVRLSAFERARLTDIGTRALMTTMTAFWQAARACSVMQGIALTAAPAIRDASADASAAPSALRAGVGSSQVTALLSQNRSLRRINLVALPLALVLCVVMAAMVFTRSRKSEPSRATPPTTAESHATRAPVAPTEPVAAAERVAPAQETPVRTPDPPPTPTVADAGVQAEARVQPAARRPRATRSPTRTPVGTTSTRRPLDLGY